MGVKNIHTTVYGICIKVGFSIKGNSCCLMCSTSTQRFVILSGVQLAASLNERERERRRHCGGRQVMDARLLQTFALNQNSCSKLYLLINLICSKTFRFNIGLFIVLEFYQPDGHDDYIKY